VRTSCSDSQGNMLVLSELAKDCASLTSSNPANLRLYLSLTINVMYPDNSFLLSLNLFHGKFKYDEYLCV